MSFMEKYNDAAKRAVETLCVNGFGQWVRDFVFDAKGNIYPYCNGMLLRAADESGISYGIPETSEYIGENEKEKLSVIEAAGYGDLIDDYICEVPGRPLNRTMLDRLYEGVSLYLISKIRENMDIVSVGKGWTPVPASMEDWQSLPSQHTSVWVQKRLG